MHRRLAPWTVALVLVAATLAGCGGSDAPTGSAEAPPASTSTSTGGSTGSGSGGDTETRQLFAQSCGSCHTFAAGGTDGQQGPNLDQIDGAAAEIRAKIEDGGGGMPAFGSQLDASQIQALTDFLVDGRP